MSSPLGWALAAHIVGLVFWIGGLLAATQALAGRSRESSAEARAVLASLARKLLKSLAHPGAALTVIAGVAMLRIRPADLQQGWLHVKLMLVLVLMAADLLMTVRVRAVQDGRAEIGAGRARLEHGVIALLLLAIVILAVIKPQGV
jgi:protoporphyrinogen IX oxidase